MLRKLGLLLALAVAMVASGARAIPIADSQLYVVISKNGTELHLNLGAFNVPHTLDLASQIASISAFGGNLNGATVAAIGVVNRNALSDDFGFGPQPLENIVFSTPFDGSQLDDQQIAQGMNTALLWLNTITTVSSSTVLTSNSSAYGVFLGADVGSAFPFSINGVLGTEISLPMYVATRGYADFGGPPKAIFQFGSLSITGAGALTYVPEPGTLLLLAAGLAGFAGLERRSRRR